MRRTHLGAIAFVVASGTWAVLFWWAHWGTREPATLVTLLEWLSPAACGLSMLAAAGTALACTREVSGWLKPLGRAGWALLFGIVTATLVARLATVPATERVYYDEHTYLQLARGLADEGRARVASYALIEDRHYRCEIGSYGHSSLGWPTLLAVLLRLSGYARWTGAVTSLGLSLATIVLVALLALALVPHRPVWLLAAAVYACSPPNQIWSRTSASEVFAAFAATWAVLCTVRFAQEPSRRLGLLMAASIAMAVQVRNESVLLLPVCAVLAGSLGGRRALREAGWPAAITVVLLLPQGLHLAHVSRAYDPNLAEGTGFGVRFVASNLDSLLQYLRSEWIVLGFLVVALFGASGARLGKAALGVWAWAACAWLAPLAHFGGSYTFPGGERFALAWLPAISLGAGCGLYLAHRAMTTWVPPRLLMAAWTAVFLAALMRAGPHAAVEDAKTGVPRRDCAFLRTALASLPQDAMIVSSDPPVVLAEGRSAVFLPWAGSDQARIEDVARRYQGRLYYFVSPSSSPGQWRDGPECERRITSLLQAEPVKQSHTADGLRALYRLR